MSEGESRLGVGGERETALPSSDENILDEFMPTDKNKSVALHTPDDTIGDELQLGAAVDAAVASRLAKEAEKLTAEAARPLDLRSTGRNWGDYLFKRMCTGSAVLILATLAAVALFLIVTAWPALSDPELSLRSIGVADPVNLLQFTIPQIFGTLLGAVLAMLLAVPVAVGVALFISHYAPRRLAAGLSYVVDLLAAVPSVIYGLWGALWLLPKLVPLNVWLSENLGWIPLFTGPVSTTGRVMACASIILAVMILPIITAVSREVFLETPVLHTEAALALGATRWEMVRMTVLPYGRSGVISAAMLGLGRALGETMAVVMVLSVGSSLSLNILQAGQHSTIAANIALQFPESTGKETAALVAAGLALFVITMVVNMGARSIVQRTKNKLEGK